MSRCKCQDVCIIRNPGGLLSPKSYVDVPAETYKNWLSLDQFFAQLPTHQYTFLDRKAPSFVQIGCFLQ